MLLTDGDEKDTAEESSASAPIDTEIQAEPDAEETGSSAGTEITDTKPAAEQNVPYPRFKEINDQRKAAEAQVVQLTQQVANLAAKIEAGAKPPAAAVQQVTDRLEKLLQTRFADEKTQAFFEETIQPIVAELQEERRTNQEARDRATADSQATAVLSQIDQLTAGSYPLADKEWVISRLIVTPTSSVPGQTHQQYVAELVKQSHERETAKEKNWRDKYVKTKADESKHKAKTPAGTAPAGKKETKSDWRSQLKEADKMVQQMNTSD